MATIFITGHRGYIGSALFRIICDLPQIENVVGYDLVDGDDILDYERLLTVMKQTQPDIVIHLAALSSVSACNDNPKLAIKTNGHGTVNILKAMAEVNCQHIIYASTSSVYGNSNALPYTELHELNPCSPYGLSKLLGEQAIFNHYHVQGNQGNYFIYRMFNVVGTCGYPDIDCRKFPGNDRLFSALESGHVTIYGNDYHTLDGTCQRDYVSLKDVCNAYLLGITQLACKFNVRQVVNIATGEPLSVKWIIDVWNNISTRIGKSGNSDYNKIPRITPSIGQRREGDPEKVYGSTKKAMSVLNWKANKKIEDIIFDLAHDKKN